MPVVWKGGPGHKAPYRTSLVRVPDPIKPAVVEMCDDYRRGALIDHPATESSSGPDVQAAIAILIEAHNIDSRYSNKELIKDAITALGGTPPPPKQRGKKSKKV